LRPAKSPDFENKKVTFKIGDKKMIPIQATKTVIVTAPQLKNNGDAAGLTTVDTMNWGHARFLFVIGTTDAAIGSTAEGTAPKIEECDTTDGSYTDITSAVLADAIAATEDDSLFAIDVDLTKSHKRYMQPDAPHVGNGTTGANLCILCILSKPEGERPVSAAGQGLAELINA
jgi:hypothetical protein